MKFGVSRNTLFAIAGAVWTVAGINILCIGIRCWMGLRQPVIAILVGVVAVFLCFHFGVFSRMYRRHVGRIAMMGDSNSPVSFFDARGWLIMLFMIGLGVTVRRYSLLPDWFIAAFYTGLSSALIVTGVRFLFTSRQRRL